MTRAVWGAIGDSITAGVGTTNAWKYAYPIQAGIDADGKPGQALSVAGWLPPLMETFNESVDRLIGLNVNSIVVEIGINDLNVMTNPAYAGAITDELMEADYTALQHMGKAKGVRVFLSTITPWGATRTGVSQAMIHRRNRINRWIRTHNHYVEYAQALGGQTMLAKWDSGDGLHPGNKGAAQMAATLTAFMTKYRRY